MQLVKIKISRDFSPTPGPRYIAEGNNSGELFRQEVLYPIFSKALEDGNKIEVNLDGTAGYGTSFLEEAFGGLIRIHGFTHEDITSNITIISEEEDYLKDDIFQYLQDAKEESKK